MWEDAAHGLGDAAREEPALRQLVEELKSGDPAPVEDLSFLRPAEKPGVLGLLGPYEVQEEIGRGGMGVVLKAVDSTLNRVVAIKVLSPFLACSATARRRFTRESKAAAAVCHDHIVTVPAVAEVDGLPYMVMQYVAGESLQARLDRAGPLDVKEIIHIGLQTASGLAAAHAQGLIHRDIKPANLLLEGEPGALATGGVRVRITDFGLARTADDVQLTREGVVAGTPEYMAPEQARGEPVDHRADLFSLGSVLYAMSTGFPPFRGTSPLAVLRQVTEAIPAPVRERNSEVPAWLEAVIMRLLAKDRQAGSCRRRGDGGGSLLEMDTLALPPRAGSGPRAGIARHLGQAFPCTAGSPVADRQHGPAGAAPNSGAARDPDGRGIGHGLLAGRARRPDAQGRQRGETLPSGFPGSKDQQPILELRPA